MTAAASETRVDFAGLIGVTQVSEEFRTDSNRLAQFARSVDDVNPRHLEGRIASPVFAHIPVMQSMVEVIEQITADFVLHGEHDFVFHQPIVPGQRLFTRSTLQLVRGTRAGTLFVVRSETRTHDGDPVCTQYSGCLLPGEASSGSAGDPVPERPAVARVNGSVGRFALTDDQTRRYADAARDYSPYTLDPEAAARNGFPAPIVHGMCTLAFAARAIVDEHCGGDTARLNRLGCRFTNPLFLEPGQELAVEHWTGEGGAVGFEAADRNGTIVIRNGYADISS